MTDEYLKDLSALGTTAHLYVDCDDSQMGRKVSKLLAVDVPVLVDEVWRLRAELKAAKARVAELLKLAGAKGGEA